MKNVAVIALAHRLLLQPEYWVRGVSDVSVVEDALNSVPTPQADYRASRSGVR